MSRHALTCDPDCPVVGACWCDCICHTSGSSAEEDMETEALTTEEVNGGT